MTITKIQKRKGLSYAKALAELAAKAPDNDLKAKVYSVVNAARLTYGSSWAEKKDEVVRCVTLGASTRDDLLNETPFNKQDLQEILNELVKANILRVTHRQLNSVGPKVAQYFLVDS